MATELSLGEFEIFPLEERSTTDVEDTGKIFNKGRFKGIRVTVKVTNMPLATNLTVSVNSFDRATGEKIKQLVSAAINQTSLGGSSGQAIFIVAPGVPDSAGISVNDYLGPTFNVEAVLSAANATTYQVGAHLI